MNDTEFQELSQVRNFINASNGISFKPANQLEGYKWIARTLKRCNYFRLSKKDKGPADRIRCQGLTNDIRSTISFRLDPL